MQQVMSPDDIPRSIGRVLDLLEIVLSRGRCNLTTAATEAGLTPTTALRHLRALEARGYLTRDEAGLFSAGPSIHRLVATVGPVSPLDRLIAVAQPHLDRLAATTGESCYLAVVEGDNATYLATAESSRTIRHVGRIGQKLPLEGTAVGAALAQPGTPFVRTGSIEADITALSAAIGNYGPVRAAVSIVGPSHRLDRSAQSRAIEALTDTIAALRADLGPGLNPVAEPLAALEPESRTQPGPTP